MSHYEGCGSAGAYADGICIAMLLYERDARDEAMRTGRNKWIRRYEAEGELVVARARVARLEAENERLRRLVEEVRA